MGVGRQAARRETAGRGNGFTASQRRSSVLVAVGEYRRAMREFAGQNNLTVWYAYLAAEDRFAEVRAALDPATAKRTAQAMSKAKTHDHLQAFRKLVRVEGGELRFVSDPPLLVPIEELTEADGAAPTIAGIKDAIRSYRDSLSPDRQHLLDQFRLVHVARKVVGVGSVGTRAWVALMLGRGTDDPLILQIKEAQASVLEDFAGRSVYTNAGRRVVVGQHTMQASSDILLGWQRSRGFDDVPRDFYVRQLHDWKGAVEVQQMTLAAMTSYGRLCGWTLARAHARSGDRIEIAGYLGAGPVFDEAVADFATAYAEQNERDHAALVAAVRSGRTPVATVP